MRCWQRPRCIIFAILLVLECIYSSSELAQLLYLIKQCPLGIYIVQGRELNSATKFRSRDARPHSMLILSTLPSSKAHDSEPLALPTGDDLADMITISADGVSICIKGTEAEKY